jgi:YVTN family beta-propeller protein
MRHAFLRLLSVLVLCLDCTAAATAAPYVYTSLPFSDSVSIIDPVNNTLIGTVHLVKGTSVCFTPAGLAHTPNGAKVYVACLNSPFVFVIDTATNTVAATVSLPDGSRSQHIAIAPDGLKAYVAIQDSSAVGVIDTSTNTLITTITGTGEFGSPHGIAITPDGSKVYASNSVINLATNTITTLEVGSDAIGVVVTPDSKKAYVGNLEGIFVINTMNNTVIKTIPSLAGHLAISPDGAEVWGPELSQGLGVIRTSDDSILGTFPLSVDSMAFTSDGTRVYAVAADASNAVLVINASSKTLITSVANSSTSGYSHITVTPGALGLSVAIDIKPRAFPNCFNIDGNGVIPVAVLGSSSFNVNNVDINTLSFAGLDVRVRGNNTRQCSVEDVSGNFTSPEGAPDGYPDLVCQFVDDPTRWTPDDGTATLTGKLLNGTSFKGIDSICLVP